MYVTDGGLETELIFHDGLDLPHFAAFPLMDSEAGRRRLRRYYLGYAAIAREEGLGFAADAPTWRANTDWGALLGYGPADLRRVNAEAITLMREVAAESGLDGVRVGGVVGPRGDGYRPDSHMSVDDARRYHAPQMEALAGARAAVVTALTLTYVDEAVGVTMAAADAEVPVAISFTVETDGRLPDGTSLGEAIDRVDDTSRVAPAWFGVNCAHPDHVMPGLHAAAAWTGRIGQVRGNASRMSHAELDEAEALDAGDPADFGASHRPLRDMLPSVQVIGGCCGTDHRHVASLARAWGPAQGRTRPGT